MNVETIIGSAVPAPPVPGPFLTPLVTVTPQLNPVLDTTLGSVFVMVGPNSSAAMSVDATASIEAGLSQVITFLWQNTYVATRNAPIPLGLLTRSINNFYACQPMNWASMAFIWNGTVYIQSGHLVDIA